MKATEAKMVSSTTPRWGGYLGESTYGLTISISVQGSNEKEVLARAAAIQRFAEAGRVDA